MARSFSSPTESRLLYALAANLGQTVTTETLLARGWAETGTRTPRTCRSRCGACAEGGGRPEPSGHVQTVQGIGYRLVATPERP